ncbi:hypothetical protein HDU99_000632, partial [Rhizoclosmatium hyalinum]
IHFKDCWEDWDYLAPSCYMNGVDIEVTEARPLDAALFSHKFKSAGYRFQVATALGTSKIVYISGGTPCGMFNDLDQAQRTLLLELEDGEKVAADKGYRGDPRTITKLSGNSDAVKSHNRNITLMGARHETVNRRMKDFHILAGMFRGRSEEIIRIFCAVANITNIKLQNSLCLI